MSTEQFIPILAGIGAIIVFVLSHKKVSKTVKGLLFILFPAIIITSTILQATFLKNKETKEAVQDTKIDQIDTHVRASLRFEGFIDAAEMNRQLGRLDEAIFDVACALQKEPKSSRALNLLGVLYFDKGDYNKAIEIFTNIETGLRDSTITVSSGRWMYHRNFGEAYMKKGLWKEAKGQFQNCLALNDNDLLCYVELAKVLDRLKEWQALYDLCKDGVARFPTSVHLHNFLGEACIVTSRLEEGEQALLRAVEADSTFGQPYLFLSIIYYVRNEHEKSEDLVKRALQLDPSLVEDVKTLRQKKLLK